MERTERSVDYTSDTSPAPSRREPPFRYSPLFRAWCGFKRSLAHPEGNARIVLLAIIAGVLSCALLLPIVMT